MHRSWHEGRFEPWRVRYPAALPCGVRNRAKARCHQNSPCAEHTGVLQYWVFECARVRFERLGGGAGAAAIGSTAPRARVDNACSTHPLADVLVPITSESIATWYA